MVMHRRSTTGHLGRCGGEVFAVEVNTERNQEGLGCLLCGDQINSGCGSDHPQRRTWHR
jgi:hypothetical protein